MFENLPIPIALGRRPLVERDVTDLWGIRDALCDEIDVAIDASKYPIQSIRVLDSVWLHRIDDETLIYKLPRPDVHGRTELVLTPHELLQCSATITNPRPLPHFCMLGFTQE